MQRHQLEHIIRAASGITGAAEFVIVGSQAIIQARLECTVLSEQTRKLCEARLQRLLASE
jgi:hypothetical protein